MQQTTHTVYKYTFTLEVRFLLQVVVPLSIDIKVGIFLRTDLLFFSSFYALSMQNYSSHEKRVRHN